jgi:hypothetical protein
MELWHNDVDGGGEDYLIEMYKSYCKAFAKAFLYQYCFLMRVVE